MVWFDGLLMGFCVFCDFLCESKMSMLELSVGCIAYGIRHFCSAV